MNYRPISLLSALYKTFTKVISNIIRATVEFNQPRGPAGSRKGYSTIGHFHVINQVIEKSAEYNNPFYISFAEYEKAFDSVEIPTVLDALRLQGICDNYLNTIGRFYSHLILLRKSKKISIQKGVRQGDTISPMLFTASLEEIFKRLYRDDKGLRINSEYLSNLRFAMNKYALRMMAEKRRKWLKTQAEKALR